MLVIEKDQDKAALCKAMYCYSEVVYKQALRLARYGYKLDSRKKMEELEQASKTSASLNLACAGDLLHKFNQAKSMLRCIG
jgi:hypothetical protein